MARRVVAHDETREARRIRETFQDAPSTERYELDWEWPERMVEAGECVAVMYTSDKWRRKGSFQDYKHVAEGPQLAFLRPGFLVDGSTGKPMRLEGPTVSVGKSLPRTIARLAHVLGIQVRLYERDDDGDLVLPETGGLYQVDIPLAELGAAVHPTTGETFLVVYSQNEVVALVTGDRLDVTRDGIVG